MLGGERNRQEENLKLLILVGPIQAIYEENEIDIGPITKEKNNDRNRMEH